MSIAADLAEQISGSLLAFRAVQGIASSRRVEEQFLKNVLKIDVAGPAEAFVQSERDAVAPVDLGEQPCVQRVLYQTAENARILHCRHQETLPGAAAADNKIRRAAVERDPRHKAGLNIRQLSLFRCAAYVENFMSGGGERFGYERVLCPG